MNQEQIYFKTSIDDDGSSYRQVFVNPIKRTLCASCEHMWDGCGEPCPRKNCTDHTETCDGYKRMSDEDLIHFAPQFWDETFVHHIISDKEARQLNVDVTFAWQPVRPLLSQTNAKQLSLF